VDGVIRIPLPQPRCGDFDARNPRAACALPHFVAGPENRLVLVAREAMVRGDWTLSPYVLHGPSGVGKSHLVRGVAAELLARRPEARVVVRHASETTFDFGQRNSTDNGTTQTSAERQLDLLVLEDVDELRDKPPAQQRAVCWLDAVVQRRGIVVVTSRLGPTVFREFSPALRSRLVGGLVVPLALPAMQTRVELLRDFAHELPIPLTDEAARLLATELSGCASQLRGALMTLASGALPIDVPAVQRYLESRESVTSPIGLRAVALRAARYFGVELAHMKSASRQRNVVEARAVAMYLARQLTGKSLKEIGDYFGGRDHTTVLHNCGRTDELLRNDPATLAAVSALRQKLTAMRQNAAARPLRQRCGDRVASSLVFSR
jgi:chromosomal replication initiator protein